MDDDGGVCWFQTVAEEEEYREWLDNIEQKKAMAEPVNQPVEKEKEHVRINCKRFGWRRLQAGSGRRICSPLLVDGGPWNAAR